MANPVLVLRWKRDSFFSLRVLRHGGGLASPSAGGSQVSSAMEFSQAQRWPPETRRFLFAMAGLYHEIWFGPGSRHGGSIFGSAAAPYGIRDKPAAFRVATVVSLSSDGGTPRACGGGRRRAW
ncbi:uncharacterized protein LOC106767994 isoform X2 [Vigna radiata var. radiata]|uniref:Uncharacterized protein LOC106767994 isoform X2 n=1 Tax=Vigna radiata var. radiata TaxID=3916 RepID=A0A1S3UR02_VIGRR|nr:uncharacterized protein LOC106767994 isoform X2 [Vigna radiata var. radiata]